MADNAPAKDKTVPIILGLILLVLVAGGGFYLFQADADKKAASRDAYQNSIKDQLHSTISRAVGGR
jgi:flagellar basal body-associated protein FliL